MTEIMPLNFYQRLGCDESASYEDLRRNFQELALKHHPDKLDKSDLAAIEGEDSEEFLQIMEAWNTLRDEKKRKMYDAMLLKEKCEIQNAVYATLSWDKLDFDGRVYSCICRCGSVYQLDASERTAEEISVQCDGCSLELIIKNVE